MGRQYAETRQANLPPCNRKWTHPAGPRMRIILNKGIFRVLCCFHEDPFALACSSASLIGVLPVDGPGRIPRPLANPGYRRRY